MSDRQIEPKTQPAGGVPAAKASAEAGTMSPETASLLGLIYRLGSLLERSDVIEIEVESGETGIVLRKPSALLPVGVIPVTTVVTEIQYGPEERAYVLFLDGRTETT